MSLELRHEEPHQKFVATVEGEHCVIDYAKPLPKVLDFTSTRVPDTLGGRGIGTQFVKAALDWAREHDYQVIPSCPFVAHVMDKDPDYAALRADAA